MRSTVDALDAAAVARSSREPRPRRHRLHPSPPDRDRPGDRRAGRAGARAPAPYCGSIPTRPASTGSSRATDSSSTRRSPGRRHLLRARRRRHDPHRAAHVRRHRGPGVRRQLRRNRVPRDGRPRGRAEAGFQRAFAGDFEVLSLPGICAVRRARGVAGDQRRLDAPPAGQAGRRPRVLRSGPDEIGRVRCDGLVVATPAGSTGYNLANGGPVMAWGVDGFVVSFIAPHSLTARALVVAPQDVAGRPQPLAGGAGRRHRRRAAGVRAAARRKQVDGAVRRRSGHARADPGDDASTSGCARSSGAWRRRRRPRRAPWPDPDRRDPSAAPGTPLPMLHELRVENLLLMERAELRLVPGLNVLTGETGAGKTLLAHALDLLLGGRARSGIVREGAAEAYVEGVFSLPPELDPASDERIPADAEEIVLARRVWPDGRTRAYVCGRSATRRRPARARRPAALLLRPARAPQADARRRPARDPRRALRSGAA